MNAPAARNGVEVKSLYVLEQRVKEGKMSKDEFQRILLELYAPFMQRNFPKKSFDK